MLLSPFVQGCPFRHTSAPGRVKNPTPSCASVCGRSTPRGMSSGGSSALAVTLAKVVTKRLPRPARVAARRKQTVFGLGARTGSPEPTTIYCDAPASVEPASGAEKGLALAWGAPLGGASLDPRAPNTASTTPPSRQPITNA